MTGINLWAVVVVVSLECFCLCTVSIAQCSAVCWKGEENSALHTFTHTYVPTLSLLHMFVHDKSSTADIFTHIYVHIYRYMTLTLYNIRV